MRRRYLYIALVVVLSFGICYNALGLAKNNEAETEVFPPSRLEDQMVNDVKVETLSSEVGDQIGIALTIYNVNLGLVKDQRKLKILRGAGDLRFMEVVSHIIP